MDSKSKKIIQETEPYSRQEFIERIKKQREANSLELTILVTITKNELKPLPISLKPYFLCYPAQPL